MAFIHTVTEDDASPAAAEHFETDRAAMGYIPNYSRTFALRPKVYEAWKQLALAVKAGMDPRRYELATVAAAAALRSSYCTLAHGKLLAERFLPVEAVVDLVTDPATAPLDPADLAVVDLARKVALAADQVTQEDIDALRAHGLCDEEILDVCLAAAARCFFSKALDATGTTADAAYKKNLPPELLDALTVGRPITDG
jgi:uncharacterized peroxidase-related enzyme